MSDALRNILNNEALVSDEELLNYLNNRLSPEERALLEQRLVSSDLLSDAEEGLQLLQHKEQVPQVVAQLNRRLIDQLRKKRKRKPAALPSLKLLVMSTLLLLLLIVMAFIIVTQLLKS